MLGVDLEKQLNAIEYAQLSHIFIKTLLIAVGSYQLNIFKNQRHANGVEFATLEERSIQLKTSETVWPYLSKNRIGSLFLDDSFGKNAQNQV